MTSESMREKLVSGPKQTPMPSPTGTDLESEEFNLIWNVIKSWDVNVPEYYEGYCGASGSHVMLILNELRKLQKSYEKVIEDNKKLIEALKYYAGADQWGHISKDDATYSVMDSDDLGIGEFQFNEIVDDKRVAGLKARQVLKELGIE